MDDQQAADAGPVLFRAASPTYSELSNLHPCIVTIDGRRWRSSEHFYQAAKFEDHAIVREIRDAETAGHAYRVAAKHREHQRDDWTDELRLEVMRRAVEAKFTQNVDLRLLLVGTGDRFLVENTSNRFWGRGRDGKGSNWLGVVLMDLRAALAADGSGTSQVAD